MTEQKTETIAENHFEDDITISKAIEIAEEILEEIQQYRVENGGRIAEYNKK